MPCFDIFASPRWSPLRMRTQVASIFIFSQELSIANKKIKALRPKMTKKASRGPVFTGAFSKRSVSYLFFLPANPVFSDCMHVTPNQNYIASNFISPHRKGTKRGSPRFFLQAAYRCAYIITGPGERRHVIGPKLQQIFDSLRYLNFDVWSILKEVLFGQDGGVDLPPWHDPIESYFNARVFGQ